MYVAGTRCHASAGSSSFKKWAGLNGLEFSAGLVLGSVRIGTGSMNLDAVIV